MDEEHLIGVLESKRFKALAETGSSSSGQGDASVRAQDELRIFDIPLDAPAEDRLIYGYLEGSGEAGAATRYGAIVVGFHDCVREQATFVLGDGRDATLLSPVFAPVPLLDPSIDAFSNMKDGLLDASTLGEACADGYGYAEVQIHGGLSSKCIARVV